MAISYDDWKKQYEGMTTEQQAKYAGMVKGNATAEEYANRYIQEKGLGNTNSNGSTNQNNTVNNTQWTNTTPSNTNTSNSNNQNGTNWGNTQQPNYFSEQNITDNSEEAKAARARGLQNMQNQQNQGGSPLSDGRNGNGNTYGKFVFDADEYLDKSKFGKSDGTGIQVKEGTAAQTGRPDYTAEDTNRLNEMIHNLNEYRNTNPSFFNDRETFNRVFEYNQRESQAQRDLLDSYWKKAQDYKKASSYNNSSSFGTDLDNGNISESEFEALKQYNQDVYIKWQQDMQNKLNSAIANLANPFSIDDMTTALNKIVEKFNLQAGDPYKVIEGWEDMMKRTGAWDSMKEAQKQFTDADATIAKIKSIQKSYSNSTSNLSSARMNKALEPYISLLSNQLASGQHWQSLYQTQLGTANDYASTIVKQGQEDTRVFNDKLNALKFAMAADSYRTPEQQQQLLLQTEQIRNDMSLLNQSKLNDLSLYNQYATAKLNNQLEAELTNLDVSDPAQQRANLNRVVGQYFQQYGDIIQRSQSQVVDDVLAYAKANGISVGQALSENFIKPLQNKQEYKNMVASTYPTPENKYQPHWKQTMDEKGNITWTAEGYGELQDMFANIYDRSGVRNSVSTLSDMVSNPVEFMSALQQLYPQGTYGGECGEFCNDILEYGFGDSTHFGSNFQNEKLIHRNKYAYEKPEVGDVYLMSNKKNPNGHMGLIADVSSNGDVTIVDSNGILDDDGKGTHEVRYKTYSASEWEKLCNSGIGNYKVEGYYQSPSVANSNPMTNSFKNAISNVKGATAVERAAVANGKRIYDSFAMMKKNGEMESLIRDSFGKDLFGNLVTQQFSSEKGTGDSFYQALQNTLTNEVTKGSIDNTTKAAILNVARAVEIKLRKESGAAISASEWQSNFFNYMPGQGKGLQADIESLQAWDSLIESWVGNWLNEGQPYQPLFDRSYIFSVQDGYTGSFITDVNNLPASAKKKDSSKWYGYGTEILKNMYAPGLSLLNTIFNK